MGGHLYAKQLSLNCRYLPAMRQLEGGSWRSWKSFTPLNDVEEVVNQPFCKLTEEVFSVHSVKVHSDYESIVMYTTEIRKRNVVYQ